MASIAPSTLFNPATEDWESYMDRFHMFLKCNDLKDATGPKKQAIFLTHCGPAVFKMAKALAKPADVTAMDWADLEPLLRKHYAPAVPILIRRHEFYRRDQRSGESLSDFVAELRHLGGLCEFSNMNEALRDRIVLGLWDPVLQSRLMAKDNSALADAISEDAAAEATRQSADRMRRKPPAINWGNPTMQGSTTFNEVHLFYVYQAAKIFVSLKVSLSFSN